MSKTERGKATLQKFIYRVAKKSGFLQFFGQIFAKKFFSKITLWEVFYARNNNLHNSLLKYFCGFQKISADSTPSPNQCQRDLGKFLYF
jgi:uncharacterized protein (DUF1810 family)